MYSIDKLTKIIRENQYEKRNKNKNKINDFMIFDYLQNSHYYHFILIWIMPVIATTQLKTMTYCFKIYFNYIVPVFINYIQ
jgi:hypothetical protein